MEDIALELGDDIELPRFFIVEKDALRSCQVRCQWFLDFQPPADCGPLAADRLVTRTGQSRLCFLLETSAP